MTSTRARRARGRSSGIPRIVSLNPSSALEGPDPDRMGTFEGDRACAVTGGGLVALLSAAQGLTGLWQGIAPWTGSLDLLADGERPAPGSVLQAGAGCWRRVVGVERSGLIEERGLLSDRPPALVLQWRWLPPGDGGPSATSPVRRLTVRVTGTGGGDQMSLDVGLRPGRTAAVALLSEGLGDEQAVRSLAPLRARELQRTTRAERSETASLRIELNDGGPVAALDDAILALDDASLAWPARQAPPTPLLAGVDEGRPRFLGGPDLAETGMAALAAGRFDLAWHVLEVLGNEGGASSLPILRLADAWTLWTGRPDRLASLGVRLPSLTDGGRHATPAHGAGRAGLPAPQAFDRPDPATYAPRRTLHSARLIRAWVEGALGARPDSVFGRLRLGPEVQPDWHALSVRGIPVGDATVSFEYRREEERRWFLLRQESGRVPINLIFEPLLPMPAVREVRIGNEPAAVSLSKEGPSMRLRCQFPLDPERRLTVVH